MTEPVDRQNAITEIEHVWVDMPDGVRLSARLWLPVTPDPAGTPAILEYIPYRKSDMVRVRDERNHSYLASRGYACVRVDMRGSGDSEGLKPDMYDRHELDDALCVIDWISKQSWCDGNVGMMGTSWGGTASLQAAARRPAALKAVIAVCSTSNRFSDDIHHMGGCLLTDTVEWGATLPGILASPPDPEVVGDGWRDMWMQRLEALTFPLEDWVRHEAFDEYWRWGSVSETPEAIECPVLAIGGWVDRYSNTVLKILEMSRRNCWGIVGPWGHHYPDVACPGPGIGFQQEALRWWNHWLKGHDNGIDREPKLRVWMQSFAPPRDTIEIRPGRWISEKAWSSKVVEPVKFYLSDHALVESKPSEISLAQVPWSLAVGGAAGDTGFFGRVGGLPVDQASDDEGSLVFETEPLDAPMEILGAPVCSFECVRDKQNAGLVVRLNDVCPTGEVARVAFGVRNLALNEDGSVPDRSERDGKKIASIIMNNTAYRFEAGHRIRLAVSLSYWPMIWPSPEAVNLSLLTGESTITLPVRPLDSKDDSILFSEPSVPPGSPTTTVVSAPALSRMSELDPADNTADIGWKQDLVCVRHETIGLEFGYETQGSHTIDLNDPVTACSRFDHLMRFRRDGLQITVRSSAHLASSVEEYRMCGTVRVEENGSVIFERHWKPHSKRCFS